MDKLPPESNYVLLYMFVCVCVWGGVISRGRFVAPRDRSSGAVLMHCNLIEHGNCQDSRLKSIPLNYVLVLIVHIRVSFSSTLVGLCKDQFALHKQNNLTIYFKFFRQLTVKITYQ
jgi:hypothetical protein